MTHPLVTHDSTAHEVIWAIISGKTFAYKKVLHILRVVVMGGFSPSCKLRKWPM